MTGSAETGPIQAAGTVLWRHADDGPEIGLVHRVRQQDWSLPKGKLEPGEHLLAAAVREVQEETGQRVALGRPLPTMSYDVLGVPKVVHYWAARGVVHDFTPTEEVDEVAWLPPASARARLTYPRDRDLVDALVEGALDTVPLVLLRHAKAVKRRAWEQDDELRPLEERGFADSERLVPLLAAYGVREVHSSDSVRCMETVAPFAAAHGLVVEAEPLLSEPGHEASPEAALERMAALLRRREPIVVCTHRPVLREVFGRLLVGPDLPGPDDMLQPGAFLVLHRVFRPDDDASAGPDDGTALPTLAAVERHRP